MNDIIGLFIFFIIAYFYGTILFAIPITRLFTGKDIRSIGNTNPGTSNVFKNVGVFPGIIVALLDMSKGIVPVLFARILIFSSNSFPHWVFLYLIGMAAIIGHARPFWNRFRKGGGGMGTATGLCAYIVPVEFAIAIIIGIIITYGFMKNAKYKFGRWVMMYAALVLPFIVLILNNRVFFKLFAHVSLGGHSAGVVLGSFLLLILMFLLNLEDLLHWLKNPSSGVNPRRDGH